MSHLIIVTGCLLSTSAPEPHETRPGSRHKIELFTTVDLTRGIQEVQACHGGNDNK